MVDNKNINCTGNIYENSWFDENNRVYIIYTLESII